MFGVGEGTWCYFIMKLEEHGGAVVSNTKKVLGSNQDHMLNKLSLTSLSIKRFYVRYNCARETQLIFCING